MLNAAAAEPPSWVLTIQPKLLDLAQAEGLMQPPPQAAVPPSYNPPGLSLIRKIRVKLLGDAAAGTPDVMREWDRAEHSGPYQQALQIRCASLTTCGMIEHGVYCCATMQQHMRQWSAPATAEMFGSFACINWLDLATQVP